MDICLNFINITKCQADGTKIFYYAAVVLPIFGNPDNDKGPSRLGFKGIVLVLKFFFQTIKLKVNFVLIHEYRKFFESNVFTSVFSIALILLRTSGLESVCCPGDWRGA